MNSFVGVATGVVVIAALAVSRAAQPAAETAPAPSPTVVRSVADSAEMPLGNFSVSLAVKDIAASRAFYEKLGFKVFGGDQKQRWLILQNGSVAIGLFQGMFEKNTLTFNPGGHPTGKDLPEFVDIRELQRRVKKAGITPLKEADEKSTGPASFFLQDPDGNPILIDQFR